ncbi:unnamed protein product [Bursaphelenchus okinawaensis]|uniref:Uncharacterized protein n=1 Tax=Bursaphelenchus okinawaensis TaxID=465554 RepID=A0A811KCQ8_9BILA|nr:unnamed protein product [Bursaphelenchus okinawaensis]CAG9101077.1 unnamed protein product [Bursaphelenchus okinawaensis]
MFVRSNQGTNGTIQFRFVVSSDQELCVTYTTFKDSSTQLKATRFTQCQSTQVMSGRDQWYYRNRGLMVPYSRNKRVI